MNKVSSFLRPFLFSKIGDWSAAQQTQNEAAFKDSFTCNYGLCLLELWGWFVEISREEPILLRVPFDYIVKGLFVGQYLFSWVLLFQGV